MLTQSTTLCIDGFSNDDINYNHSLYTYIYIYILVYSQFSDSVGLPLHKIPSSGILKKSVGAVFLRPDARSGVNHMRGMQYQIVINIAFCPKLKFVCTIITQNINMNLHSKPPFSRLLRHTWVKAVMQF